MAHSETKRPEPGAPQEMSSLLATNFLSPGSAKGGGSKSSLVDMISSGVSTGVSISEYCRSALG